MALEQPHLKVRLFYSIYLAKKENICYIYNSLIEVRIRTGTDRRGGRRQLQDVSFRLPRLQDVSFRLPRQYGSGDK